MKNKKIEMRNNNWITYWLLRARVVWEENISYTSELKNRMSFVRFLKSSCSLICWVMFVPVGLLFGVFALCYNAYIDSGQLQVFSVAFFDLFSVCATYLGTTFFALVVFYYSWLQERRKENETAIQVYAEAKMKEDGVCLFSQSEICGNNKMGANLDIDDRYSQIILMFTNQSSTAPIRIKHVCSYIKEENKIRRIENKITSYESKIKLLDFNESTEVRIGFSKEYFEKRSAQLFHVFRIKNAFEHDTYYVFNCFIDENGYCDAFDDSGILISESKYNELFEKYGIEFIKDITYRKKVKKHFFNKVYLYKR